MTDDVVERVARAIWEADVLPWETTWEQLGREFREDYLALARAALEAAGQAKILALCNAVQNAAAEAIVGEAGTTIPCGWWAKIVRMAKEVHDGA